MLGTILQIALVILIIALVVAIVQVVIILLDLRQVTKKVRAAASAFNLLECFFEGKDAGAMIKKCRKTCFRAAEMFLSAVHKLLGGEKNG